MTINGQRRILAMFANTAIDQNIDKFKTDNTATRPTPRRQNPRMGDAKQRAQRCKPIS
jgi:hypothetical protein